CAHFNCTNNAFYGPLPGVLTHCSDHRHYTTGYIIKNTTKCFKYHHTFLLATNIHHHQLTVAEEKNNSSCIPNPQPKRLIHPILIKNRYNPSLIRIVPLSILNLHQKLKPAIKPRRPIVPKLSRSIPVRNKRKPSRKILVAEE